MKRNFFPAILTALAAGLFVAPMQAADTATVKDDRLNVRGQATINSEVVTQLRKGETVTVLEIIELKEPKKDEPSRWAKIALPANTPVWVSAQFVSNSVVSGTRLNIRSGPGERFSTLGRLEKGQKVSEIRTLNDWMEIIAPPETYAFVAADFLDIKVGTPAPAKPELAVPSPAPATPPPAPPAEPVKPAPAPVVAVDNPPKPATVPTTPAENPTVPTTSVPAEKLVTNEPAPATEPTEKPPADEPPPKRVVTREGTVRGTISIQAPTSYRLVEEGSGRTINYLFVGDTGLELKYFNGKKIRVSGEESIDKRWPTMPMIKVEKLEPLN